jgi:hypothetical protein
MTATPAGPVDNGNGHTPTAAAAPAEGSPEWVAQAHRAAQEFASRERIVERGPDGRAILKPGDIIRPLSDQEHGDMVRRAAEDGTLKLRGGSAALVIPPGWSLLASDVRLLAKDSGADVVLHMRGGTDLVPAVKAAEAREAEARRRVAELVQVCPQAEALESAKSRLGKLLRGEAACAAEAEKVKAALAEADADDIPKLGTRQATAERQAGAFAGAIRAARADLAEKAAALGVAAQALATKVKAELLAEVAEAKKGTAVALAAAEGLTVLVGASILGAILGNPFWHVGAGAQATRPLLPSPEERPAGRLLTQEEVALRYQSATEQVQLRNDLGG